MSHALPAGSPTLGSRSTCLRYSAVTEACQAPKRVRPSLNGRVSAPSSAQWRPINQSPCFAGDRFCRAERHVVCPHSVVTAHLIDEAGQPTIAARTRSCPSSPAALFRQCRTSARRVSILGWVTAHDGVAHNRRPSQISRPECRLTKLLSSEAVSMPASAKRSATRSVVLLSTPEYA